MTIHRVVLVMSLSCSLLACGKSDPQPVADAKPAPAAESGAAPAGDPTANPEQVQIQGDEPPTADPVKPTEPAEPAKPAEPAEPAEPSIADADAPPAKSKLLVASAITPVAATVTWATAASPSEPLTLVELGGGVLASAPGGYYDLDDSGQLILRSEIEAWPSYADLIGEWPKNAWYVERRAGDADDRGDSADELRLMRLRNNQRWVPQEYDGEQRFVDEGQTFSIGAKGGLLVRNGDSVTRVAGGADDPDTGMYPGTELRELFETHSGRIYTASVKADLLYVQRDCADAECVEANARELPSGQRWQFPIQVPRQRHSISALAVVEQAGVETNHLLHYGAGGWQLESIATAPEGLWPSKDGGLWALVGAELWHRDPDGGWRNVALPPGAGSISVAIREDQTELWIAGRVGETPVVFKTRANAQDPEPAAPAEGATQPG
jgi:hypothetical protein